MTIPAAASVAPPPADPSYEPLVRRPAHPRRLVSTSLADATHLVTAFREDLKEAGFVEGQNVTIEFRSAEDRNDL